jgi:hypothetical protein
MKAISAAFVFGMLTTTCAVAQSLKPDAIICETEVPLALLAESNLKDQPGGVVMERVAATVKFYEASGQFHATMGNLASQERDIWKDTRTPDRGATTARLAEARAGQQNAADSQIRFQEFLRRCTATPANVQQPATVLEHRLISKTIKVKTALGAVNGEFWTHETYFLK